MKTKKKVMIGVLTGILCVGSSFSAMAGTWQKDSTGWWWREDNGSYPVNTWQWIDGDRDGTAECYYFDHNGYCLMNTATPDGYQVNASGAWTVNGTVQRQGASQSQQNVSKSTAQKLCSITDHIFQECGFVNYGNGGSSIKSMSISASDLSSEQKAWVLYAYQYNCSDRRITEVQEGWEYQHRALASDMKEIMGEIFGTVTNNDMKAYENRYASVKGNYYYMDATGDFGAMMSPYLLSSDNLSAVIENGQIKLSGNVMESQSEDWVPVKQFEAYFAPKSGSCLDGYRFERLTVR